MADPAVVSAAAVASPRASQVPGGSGLQPLWVPTLPAPGASGGKHSEHLLAPWVPRCLPGTLERCSALGAPLLLEPGKVHLLAVLEMPGLPTTFPLLVPPCQPNSPPGPLLVPLLALPVSRATKPMYEA